jgi:hypothetical protein
MRWRKRQDGLQPAVRVRRLRIGKTHLVAAIAFQARQTQPDLRVEFSTGEVAERLHKAIAAGQQAEFARRYQEVDLLLLDDVQFLTGQRETQTELLRLFNIMQGKGRQLVMTSDRPPAEIPDVDQRLLSRLSGGLIVDVGAPDYEMRLAILRNACGERSLAFSDGVLEETARLPYANVRELKGALNRLSAFQQLEGQDITAEDVRAVLGERVASVVVPPTRASHAGASDAATEYEGFLADVLQEVETRVEQWRVHLGEACAFWRTEGFATNVLERAMALPVAPDVNGLLATFAAAVEHLRNLEAQALAVDPSLRASRVPQSGDGRRGAVAARPRDRIERAAARAESGVYARGARERNGESAGAQGLRRGARAPRAALQSPLPARGERGGEDACGARAGERGAGGVASQVRGLRERRGLCRGAHRRDAGRRRRAVARAVPVGGCPHRR